MRRLILIITLCLSAACLLGATDFAEGPLRYKACYHCGFIKISAGDAVINVKLEGNRLFATMNGHSIPIGHRIYAISDTLCATMTDTGNGLGKETVTYTNAWYTKPYANQTANGIYNFSRPENYRTINGQGTLNAGKGTMEAVTISTDMLAMFYYFRQMDFGTMKPGQSMMQSITLPDGTAQQLSIEYGGPDNFNGRDTYRLTFTYSYEGSMTDYPVTAQVDRQSKLPLLFAADIRIGHIELTLDH